MPPIVVKVRDAQVTWRPGRAVIQGTADQVEPLLAALVDFSYYEAELRRLELELADSWRRLEEDTPLAYDVKQADMAEGQGRGQEDGADLAAAMRHVRIEPHLYRPAAHLPAAARDLGERLREAARVEDRSSRRRKDREFREVYESGSQRINDFRAARQGFILESVIIVLLGGREPPDARGDALVVECT